MYSLKNTFLTKESKYYFTFFHHFSIFCPIIFSNSHHIQMDQWEVVVSLLINCKRINHTELYQASGSSEMTMNTFRLKLYSTTVFFPIFLQLQNYSKDTWQRKKSKKITLFLSALAHLIILSMIIFQFLIELVIYKSFSFLSVLIVFLCQKYLIWRQLVLVFLIARVIILTTSP